MTTTNTPPGAELDRREEGDLEHAQNLLASALYADLENGVKWLNERAHVEFQQRYPALSEAISKVMMMEATQ